MTQVDMVLQHLKDYDSISTWEAIQQYGITRISDKVFRLKKKGYNIISERIIFINRYGKQGTYSKYKLGGELNENN